MNWIEVNGTSLRYEFSGGGPSTLVLVHEMGGTLDSWDQVLPALVNGRRIGDGDTRGACLSEKIEGVVTWDQMADDLAALLDALGITGRVALAGIAVGAAIAVHFAVRYPDRAAALVLHGPAIGVTADRRQGTLDRAAAVEAYWSRVRVPARTFRIIAARYCWWVARFQQARAWSSRFGLSWSTERIKRSAAGSVT